LSLTLGVFDVFTYLIPGSLYLSVIAYVADRLGWIDPGHLTKVPSLILIGAVLVASYLLGWAAEPAAELVNRKLPFRTASPNPRDVFASRTPNSASRPYVQSDPYLLLSAAEVYAKDAALEISRLRAIGLMLRNCSVPFLAASVVSIVEAVVNPARALAIISAVLFAGAALSVLHSGRRLRGWAFQKTLEICYWIPEIDAAVQPKERARRTK
jgi:hypothetical protein